MSDTQSLSRLFIYEMFRRTAYLEKVWEMTIALLQDKLDF